MTRPLVVAIHGIMTGQTDASWPDRFDAYCDRQTGIDVRVIKKEYHAAPLPAWNIFIKNPRLARAVVAEILEFSPRPIHVISHSNGTDVALGVIKRLAKLNTPVATFIAIGSVLKPDVIKTGIYQLIAKGSLRRAVAYCSRRDRAIGLARRLPTFYSSLGVNGWQMDGEPFSDANIRTHWRDDFGHGTWFAPNHREETFALALKDFQLNGDSPNVSPEI